MLDAVKNLQDLFVLVLHVYDSEFLALVFADELGELLAVLDFVETLDELVGETLDPLDVFLLDLEEGFADLALPFSDEVDVWRVLNDCLCHEILYLFKIFQLSLVALVDVLQVFARNQTLQALVALFLT